MAYTLVNNNSSNYSLYEGEPFSSFDTLEEFRYQMGKYYSGIWNIENISQRKGSGSRAEYLVKCSLNVENSSNHYFYIFLCQVEGGGRNSLPDEQRIQFRVGSQWSPNLQSLGIADAFSNSTILDNKECYFLGIYKRSEYDHDVEFIGVYPKWIYDRGLETSATSNSSFQININKIREAFLYGTAIYTKTDGQRAICFKPDNIFWYMKNRDSLHLNDLEKVEDLIIQKQNINKLNSNDSLQLIYYGAPGTGKSYEIDKKTDETNSIRTTFHPDSDYASFVGTYKPTMELVPMSAFVGKEVHIAIPQGNHTGKENKITYKFVPQAFLKAYVEAWKRYKDNEPYYLIIEEINRGNCAQIFGDLFQLLDRNNMGCSSYAINADEDIANFLREDKNGFAQKANASENGLSIEQRDAIKNFILIKDNGRRINIGDSILNGNILLLPPNLHIYATMNTSDQSLFPIDSAFKRRWDWKYVPIRYKNTDWYIDIDGVKYSWVNFQKEVNTRILKDTGSEDKMMGDYFVNPKDKVITKNLFLNKVLFYLWNDVCKDGDTDIFPSQDDFSFSKLYDQDGSSALSSMMEKLGIKPIENSEVVIQNLDED